MSFTSSFRVTAGKPVKASDYSTLAANYTAVLGRIQNRFGVAYKTADFTIANGTGNSISFDAVSFDTSSFWAGGSPTRLTIPSGIAYARIGVSLAVSALANDMAIVLKKNGASFMGKLSVQSTAQILSGYSAPIAVSATDYFELFVDNNTGGNITGKANFCWMSIEVWGT